MFSQYCCILEKAKGCLSTRFLRGTFLTIPLSIIAFIGLGFSPPANAANDIMTRTKISQFDKQKDGQQMQIFAQGLPQPIQQPTQLKQPVQLKAAEYPPQLKAIMPKTPAELKARMPNLKMIPFKPVLGPGKKVLIVLQENTGRLVYLDPYLPPEIAGMVAAVIDTLAETFEDIKNRLMGTGKYDQVVLLTDDNCKYQKLLDNLIYYTQQKMIIDLLILGHGSNEWLGLKGESLTGGEQGTIRKLLADARARGVQRINLRLVFMCNCYGASTNDDWRYIGAKGSIGPIGVNAMPEPTTTFFLNNWFGGQNMAAAVNNAYNGAIPFYSLVFPPVATARFKTVTIRYPCGGHVDLQGCCCVPVINTRYPCWVTDYCTATMQVPDGVNLQPNPHIVDSKPVPAGDVNLTFHTLSY